MALSLPVGSRFRELIVVITYSVVLFSVFVQGLTSSKVIGKVTRAHRLDCASRRDKIRRSKSPRPWRNWQTRKIQVLVPTRCGGSTPLGRNDKPRKILRG